GGGGRGGGGGGVGGEGEEPGFEGVRAAREGIRHLRSVASDRAIEREGGETLFELSGHLGRGEVDDPGDEHGARGEGCRTGKKEKQDELAHGVTRRRRSASCCRDRIRRSGGRSR